MKRVKYENVVNAAGRHLFKRNCTDSEVLKTGKLGLKQSAHQFENSILPQHSKLVSVQNCSLTETDADIQYSKLKSWVESLDEEHRVEVEDMLFPCFISLYRKLNSTGNNSGARTFYTRHQSGFFKTPELRKMAERFCSESNNHFTLEVSPKTFEVVSKYVAESDQHPVLQYLLNTTLEINIARTKTERNPSTGPSAEPLVNHVSSEALSSSEEVADLLAAIARMDELPAPAPLLKLLTIDSGARKMCTASTSNCHRFISCGFQDSSIAVWDVKKMTARAPANEPRTSSTDLACSLGHYHPATTPCRMPFVFSDGEPSVTFCRGHSGPVYSTVFTPDSAHLLSCGDDATVRLWDLSSMDNAVVYRGHTYPVWAIDILPTGLYFATASQDRTAKLWSVDRTYPLRVMAGHLLDVDCVTFHPNGLYVATGSADKTVRMWSVSEGATVRTLVGHDGTVFTVAFSPCGKLLASAGEDHRVKIWDVATNAVLHDYDGHRDVVHGLVWLSADRLASYSTDGNIRVYNTGLASVSDDPSIASYSVPQPWKPVHLGRGPQSSLVCVASSD